MNFFLIAAAISTISITITQSILIKSLRDFLHYPLIKTLFHCPYCLNHWLSIPGAWFLIPEIGIEFIIMALALTLMATIFSYPVLLVLDKLDES